MRGAGEEPEGSPNGGDPAIPASARFRFVPAWSSEVSVPVNQVGEWPVGALKSNSGTKPVVLALAGSIVRSAKDLPRRPRFGPIR